MGGRGDAPVQIAEYLDYHTTALEALALAFLRISFGWNTAAAEGKFAVDRFGKGLAALRSQGSAAHMPGCAECRTFASNLKGLRLLF
jgi:hypothetical protein